MADMLNLSISMTRVTNFALGGTPRADLHVKPPSTMGHESLSLNPLL